MSFICPKCFGSCDGYGNGCGCPSSVASACSGADARLADKAPVDSRVDTGVGITYSTPQQPVAEAAVSPRSSDGYEAIDELVMSVKKFLTLASEELEELELTINELRKSQNNTDE